MEPEILDTTLREGEQRFGVFFPVEAKASIATELSKLVRFIEIGSPTYNPSYMTAAERILGIVPRDRVVVQCVLDKSHLKVALDIGAQWIGLFIAIRRDLHQARYGRSVEDTFNRIQEAIHLCKQHGVRVRLTCEDASRTGVDELVAFYKAVIALGVEDVGFADTVGILDPNKTRSFLHALTFAGIPMSKLHVHFHNDAGFADENAEVARDLGIGCISASVGGLGERVGITNVASVIGKDVSELERMVSGYVAQKPKRELRFAHKAGLHIDGVLKNPLTYEWTSPESVGCRRIIVLSKLSGMAAVRFMIQKATEGESGKHRVSHEASAVLTALKAQEFLEMTTAEEFRSFLDTIEAR